jgi:hypothetical protein
MDQLPINSEHRAPRSLKEPLHCWPTPLERHVHDDPFSRRLPYPLRFRGGIFFEIMPSVAFIGALSTGLVLLKNYKLADLSVSTTLISVLGFIVSLTVSFRNQTAYERYIEGRKAWDSLRTTIRNLGRIIWIHVNSPMCRLRKGPARQRFRSKRYTCQEISP